VSALIYMKTAQPKDSKKKAASGSSKRSPGKREQNKERTKESILEAALQLFREKGIEGTTTKEISKKAGIAEGTLFNYFKTKEDLALYFFQKETENLIDWFRADTRLQRAPLREKLFAIIHRQLEYIEPYEEFIGAVFCRSLQPNSTLSPLSFESQELRFKYLRFIREVLADSERKGEIPPVGDLGAYAVGLFYLGIVTHWLQDTSRGKQKTLAMLDRALSLGTQVLKKGGWEW
jgi:AcrR family transcriptional regulator